MHLQNAGGRKLCQHWINVVNGLLIAQRYISYFAVNETLRFLKNIR